MVYSPSKEEQSPSEDRYGILWKKCVAQKSVALEDTQHKLTHGIANDLILHVRLAYQ